MARRLDLANPYFQEAVIRSKDMSFLGIPFSKLTKDELLVAAVIGWEAYRRHIEKDSHPVFVVATQGDLLAFGGN